MPDAFTHMLLPSLLHKRLPAKLFFSLFLIGAIIPDYLRGGLELILPPAWQPSGLIFHSAAGCLLVALLLSTAFIPHQRSSAFLSLMAGQATHLLLDAFQMHLNGGKLYLLLPWTQPMEFGLISESYWLYIFFLSLALGIVYWGIYLHKQTNLLGEKK